MKLSIFLLLSLMPIVCSSEVNVIFAGFSKHFNSSNEYNESNTSIGIEVLNTKHGATVFAYKDSYNTTAKVIAGIYRPFEYFGLMYGLIHSPSYFDGDITLMALPFIPLKLGRFGVNVFYLPKLGNNGASTLAMQFKLRVN